MNDAEIIAVLSHPLRLKIFKHFAEKAEPVSPSRLSKELDGVSSLKHLSFHVRLLAEKGALVRVEKEADRGPKQRYYIANPTATEASWVRELVGLPPVDGVEH